jgi:hypothetical protein
MRRTGGYAFSMPSEKRELTLPAERAQLVVGTLSLVALVAIVVAVVIYAL